jgi:hypothetical protein
MYHMSPGEFWWYEVTDIRDPNNANKHVNFTQY